MRARRRRNRKDRKAKKLISDITEYLPHKTAIFNHEVIVSEKGETWFLLRKRRSTYGRFSVEGIKR